MVSTCCTTKVIYVYTKFVKMRCNMYIDEEYSEKSLCCGYEAVVSSNQKFLGLQGGIDAIL